MTIPPFLKIGDSVTIVAPAGFTSKEQITFAVGVLENWGLKVVLGKNLFSKYFTFAGTDEQRFSDFQQAIDNTKIKAVFCARGGYGTLRILEKIDWTKFIKNPKWVVGYSDITAIHLCLNNILNISSVHGPMPVNFEKLINEKESLKNLKKVIFGEKIKYLLLNENKLSKSIIEGKIIGGNLSLLYSLRGTKYDFNYDNCILFIEEIGEYMYHIDRMLHNFKLGNKFENLKAVVIGGFTEIKENESPFAYSLSEIIKSTTSNKIPVINNFPAGHAIPNFPIILGNKVKITISNEEIIFEQN